MEAQAQQQHPQQIVVRSTKSTGIAILLAILLGPLGMLYSTITGGFIMFFVGGIFILITGGLGLLITWPVCVIWAAIAANSYNSKLGSGV